MTQKKPSILKMVQNFAKESVKFIKQGAPVCSEEEYHERMSICMSCEHFTEKQSCGICGCRMPVKAGWKTSECADTPKRWDKLVLTDKEVQVLKDAEEAERAAYKKDMQDIQDRAALGGGRADAVRIHNAGFNVDKNNLNKDKGDSDKE